MRVIDLPVEPNNNKTELSIDTFNGCYEFHTTLKYGFLTTILHDIFENKSNFFITLIDKQGEPYFTQFFNFNNIVTACEREYEVNND